MEWEIEPDEDARYQGHLPFHRSMISLPRLGTSWGGNTNLRGSSWTGMAHEWKFLLQKNGRNSDKWQHHGFGILFFTDIINSRELESSEENPVIGAGRREVWYQGQSPAGANCNGKWRSGQLNSSRSPISLVLLMDLPSMMPAFSRETDYLTFSNAVVNIK